MDIYNLYFYMQYPPLMSIKKNPDGTTAYVGTAVPITECFAETLGLRYVVLHSQCQFFFASRCYDRTLNLLFRIEYVPLKMSELIKYGPEMAQIRQIAKDVSFLFISQ